MKMKRRFLSWVISLCVLLAAPTSASAARYTGDDFRDPFSDLAQSEPLQTVVSEKPAAPLEFVFGGVIWVPGKPRVIINRRRLLEGGVIDGAKVVEIRRKEVTILLNGQEMILKKRPEETS